MNACDDGEFLGAIITELLRPSMLLGHGQVGEVEYAFLIRLSSRLHLAVVTVRDVLLRPVEFPLLEKLVADSDKLLKIVSVGDPKGGFGVVVGEEKVVAFTEGDWETATAMVRNDERIGLVVHKGGMLRVETAETAIEVNYAGSN